MGRKNRTKARGPNLPPQPPPPQPPNQSKPANLSRRAWAIVATLAGAGVVLAAYFLWRTGDIALFFWGVAALFTTIVAVQSAKQDQLPPIHRLMLWGAAVATIAATAWSASEQKTFEKRVLGGDGYVYVRLVALGDSASKFELRHGGERFPVYDVSADIFDLRKFEGVSIGDPRELAKRALRVERNVLGPASMASVFNDHHPADCYGYWAGIVQQRNGHVLSLVYARNVNGVWVSSTRVFRIGENLEQTFVKEYPSPGWDSPREWPRVQIKALGSFFSTTPKKNCPLTRGL